MGQVPEKRKNQLTYGLVGRGRVARHFGHYFNSEKIPFKTWCRQDAVSCAAALAGVDVVLVLISDGAIEDFVARHRQGAEGLANKIWVHFSGSLVTPLAFGCHPLMTFGDDFYAPDFYRQIPFITEAEFRDARTAQRPRFEQVFPALLNTHYAIAASSKALYHALCVMAGNFTTLLWQKAFADFQSKLDLPGSVLVPYLDQITRNLAQNPAAALTGPLARGDRNTLEKNIQALQGDPFKHVYESFVAAYQLQMRGHLS